MSRRVAVVVGASIGGLLAARALSESYDNVIVLDVDDLPSVPGPRRGTRHGVHAHGLSTRGLGHMEELFPGLTRELVDLGAVPLDLQADCIWASHGYELKRAKSNLSGLGVSRSLLEFRIRARVIELPNVEMAPQCEAVGLVTHGIGTAIAGIRVIRDGVTDVVSAGLVVDATGRRSRGRFWLHELGYAMPREEKTRTGLVCMTREYMRTPGQEHFALAGISASPQDPRGGLAVSVDGGRWLVTLVGAGKNAPPADLRGVEEFAASLTSDAIANLMRHSQPLSAPTRFHIPGNARRFYESMRSMPEGFIVVGDALCALNPLYGEGIAMAAAEAVLLRSRLASGSDGFERDFLRGSARVVDRPWRRGRILDLGYQHFGAKPTLKASVLNRMLRAMYRAAQDDSVISRTILRTANLVPGRPYLYGPRVLGVAMLATAFPRQCRTEPASGGPLR